VVKIIIEKLDVLHLILYNYFWNSIFCFYFSRVVII